MTVRIIFFIFIFILMQGICSENSCAQQTYFNNRYNLCQNYEEDAWSGADGIIQIDDGYVIVGYSVDTIYYWWRRIPLLKIDFEGTSIWEKSFGDTIADYYTGQPGSFIKSDTNEYFIAGSKNYWSPNNYDVGLLMKFNSDFDTCWTREYNLNLDNSNDTSIIFNQMAICNNKDLIFGGTMNGDRLLLLRTDSSGNMLWYKTYKYGTNTLCTGYSVIQTSDNGFALGGYQQDIVHPPTGDPLVVKTDSLGNQEWVKYFGGPYLDNKAFLTNSYDGSILVGTIYADEPIGSYNTKSRVNIIKMTNDNAIIWNNKYEESTPYNFLNTIIEIEDGSIVCCGSCFTEIPYRSGWVLKISSEGESIWYRRYTHLKNLDSQNRLHNIINTNDNGYIACGYVNPFPPDTGNRDAWVIKLDSIGCDTAGCDTTVWIAEEEKGRRGEGEIDIELWPNPCSTVLYISLSSTQPAITTCHPEHSEGSHSSYTVDIYDIFGRKVCEEITSSTRMGRGRERGWTIDVSALPPGLYLLVLNDGMTVKASAKFVVAR